MVKPLGYCCPPAMKDLPNGHKARLDAEDRLYARLKGRLLNKRRMELDMTQQEVADEASANGVRGCNGTTLGRKMWLGGGFDPSRDRGIFGDGIRWCRFAQPTG